MMSIRKRRDYTVLVCILFALACAGVGLVFLFVPDTLTAFNQFFRNANAAVITFFKDWMSFLVFLIPMLCLIGGLAPYVFSKK